MSRKASTRRLPRGLIARDHGGTIISPKIDVVHENLECGKDLRPKSEINQLYDTPPVIEG